MSQEDDGNGREGGGDSWRSEYAVPDELKGLFTEAEIEQATLLFDEVDADGSGEIDFEEMRVVVEKFGEEVSIEDLSKMFDEVDASGNGQIDFGEFLKLLSGFKNGNSKFAKLVKLFETMDNTPLVVLERECGLRDINIVYKMIRNQTESSNRSAKCVFACELSGTWREILQDGVTVNISNETRVYQGVGKNSRQAKFKSATNALASLKQYIPGINYVPGEIPNEWIQWFESNMSRGVDILKLFEKLVIKGFLPSRNIKFMHQIILRESMLQLLQEKPHLQALGQGAELPPEWTRWTKKHMHNGIHGETVLRVLVEYGFDPRRNPMLTKTMSEDRGGRCTDVLKPREAHFWTYASLGDVPSVLKFIAAGQDVNEPIFIKGNPLTPLIMAIHGDSCEVANLLLEKGANSKLHDHAERTCVHHAAQVGNVDMFKIMIRHSVDLTTRDKYGDTCLHIAVSHGHGELVKFLLTWYDARTRLFLSDGDLLLGAGTTVTFRKCLEDLFQGMLATRLTVTMKQVFPKIWFSDALSAFYKEHGKQALVMAGSNDKRVQESAYGQLSESDVSRFVNLEDPRKNCVIMEPRGAVANRLLTSHHQIADKTNLSFDDFYFLMSTYVTNCFVDATNRIGKTALILAADRLVGSTRESAREIFESLLDDYGCDSNIADTSNRTAKDSIRYQIMDLGKGYEGLSSELEAVLEEEVDISEASMEPMHDDSLFKLFFATGDLAAEWERMKTSSHRRRQIGNTHEMSNPDTKQVFYVIPPETEIFLAKPLEFIQNDRLLHGWFQMSASSTQVSSSGAWVMFQHNETGQVFYTNRLANKYQWEAPAEANFDNDVTHDEATATKICAIGPWVKWRRSSDARAYFVKRGRGTVSQFERPKEWTTYGDPDEVTPNVFVEDWQTLCSQGEVLREFGEWQEIRHVKSKLCFYYRPDQNMGTWERPKRVLEVEQGLILFRALRAMEGGRQRKRLQVIRTETDKETKWTWSEEIDLIKQPNGGSKLTKYFIGKWKGFCIAQGTEPKCLEGVKPMKSPRDFRRGNTSSNSLQAKSSARAALEKTEEVDRKAHILKQSLILLTGAEDRKNSGCAMCTWGCREWVHVDELQEHQERFCPKRLEKCKLGCGLVLAVDRWEVCRQTHETLVCSRRPVPCENLCGEHIPFEFMADHLANHCGKRPAPTINCELGCGWSRSGGLGEQETMAEEAREHVTFLCPRREVRCDWEDCMLTVMAQDLPEHRNEHLKKFGMFTWTTAGSYTYKVPSKTQTLRVELWGGGGASGMLQGCRHGNGGGGGFVSADIRVYPGEELILIVGGGGKAPPMSPSTQAINEESGHFMNNGPGGLPGGGEGRSYNITFACGGGGGFTAISRHGPFGEELIALAGGGGGGGSRNGGEGNNLAFNSKDYDDVQRSGNPGTLQAGGTPGETPAGEEPAEAGDVYQGGHGGAFGGGGGGGFYGGGGGGFSPGIVGGGGGGSSYVNQSTAISHKMVQGSGVIPGGVDRYVPASTGIGDWDITGELAGFGGIGTDETAINGANGAIRVRLPRYFDSPLVEKRVVLEAILAKVEADKIRSAPVAPSPAVSSEPATARIKTIAPRIADYSSDSSDDEGARNTVTFPSDDAPVAVVVKPKPKPEYVVGRRVMVYYEGKMHNPLYPGVIGEVNFDGTFEIFYDDGDIDNNIPKSAIKLVDEQSKP